MDRLADLGTNQWHFLQEQMSRLVQAWEGGDPGDLTRFLPPPGDVLRAITLQELVLTDLELRWRNGRGETLEYYVDRYPELGRPEDLPANLLCEEFLIRKRYGDRPAAGSYQQRFPRQFSELETLLRQQPDPRPTQGPHALPPNSLGGKGNMVTQQPEYNGYKLIRRIGGGAFADVYEAEARGGVRVALKVLRQPLTSEDAKRELDALDVIRQLSHQCLVQTHQFWVEEDHLYVVMDLADGTLRDRLQEYKQAANAETEHPGVPPEELLGYFRDAAEALDFLHSENIFHRDVKPANILLFKARRISRAKPGATEGFQVRAKLADFGLAKLIQSQQAEASGGGTLAYMAPEACRNRTTEQSDLYSLAASYAEARLGRPLYPYTNMYDLTRAHLEEKPDLAPLEVEEQKVLLRALAKDPEERFPTCMQFVTALEEVLPLPRKAIGSSRESLTVNGYRLVRLLDNVLRGELWEAVGPDGTHVALTVVRNVPRAQASEDVRTLLFLRGIEHVNLARVFDAFLLDNQNNVLAADVPPTGNAPVTLCIVRELMPESLAKRLDRYEEGIPPRELIGLMWQAAEALDTLRGPFPVEPAPRPEPPAKRPSGWRWSRSKEAAAEPPPPAWESVTVIHCAVSPRTLLVDGTRLKVGDFALARLLHSSKGLLPGSSTLLRGYVPPELYEQRGHANSDQYSLAVSYVELRTGRPPFQTTAPGALEELQRTGKLILKRLADGERDVIKRATALDPAQRYPSCREMVAALEDACFASGIRTTGRQTATTPDKPAHKGATSTLPAPTQTIRTSPLPPEDSGEFLLPAAEARKGPEKPATIPDTDPKLPSVNETIRRPPTPQPAEQAEDERLLETLGAPPKVLEPERKSAAPKKTPPEPPKAEGKAEARKDVPGPKKLSSGEVRKLPGRGKPPLRKRILATLVAIVLLGVVGGVAGYIFLNPGPKPTPEAPEAQAEKLIQERKHPEAFHLLRELTPSETLSQDRIDELHKQNARRWSEQAAEAYQKGDLDAAQATLKDLLGCYEQDQTALALQQTIRQRVQARERMEGLISDATDPSKLKAAWEGIEAFAREYSLGPEEQDRLRKKAVDQLNGSLAQRLRDAGNKEDWAGGNAAFAALFKWVAALQPSEPELAKQVEAQVLDKWVAFGRAQGKKQPEFADVAVHKEATELLNQLTEKARDRDWAGVTSTLDKLRAGLDDTRARDTILKGLPERGKTVLREVRGKPEAPPQALADVVKKLESFKKDLPQLSFALTLTGAVHHLRADRLDQFVTEIGKARDANKEAEDFQQVLLEAAARCAAAPKAAAVHWDVAKELLPEVRTTPKSHTEKALNQGYVALIDKLVPDRYVDLSKPDELLTLCERAVEVAAKPNHLTWATFVECYLLKDGKKFRGGLSDAELKKVVETGKKAAVDTATDPYVLYVRGLSAQARKDWEQSAKEYLEAFKDALKKEKLPWQTAARSGRAAEALAEAGKNLPPKKSMEYYENANRLAPRPEYLLAFLSAAKSANSLSQFDNALAAQLKNPGIAGWEVTDKVKLAELFVEAAADRTKAIGRLPEGIHEALDAALKDRENDWRYHFWSGVSSWNKEESKREAIKRFAKVLDLSHDPKAPYELVLDRMVGAEVKDQKELLDQALPADHRKAAERHKFLLKERFTLTVNNPDLLHDDLKRLAPVFSADADKISELEELYSDKGAIHARAFNNCKGYLSQKKILFNDQERKKLISTRDHHWGKLEQLLLHDKIYEQWDQAIDWAKDIAKDRDTDPKIAEQLRAKIKQHSKKP